ncbi:hypothetical protein Tco_0377361 [Tanacetum coccineum]
MLPRTYQQQQLSFPNRLKSELFQWFLKGDDLINAINHMMSFLTAVVTSRQDLLSCQVSQGMGSDASLSIGVKHIRKLSRILKLFCHTSMSDYCLCLDNLSDPSVPCTIVNIALNTELDSLKEERLAFVISLVEEVSFKNSFEIEQDPLFVKHKVNTKPINYDILHNDYYKRFVRQTDLYSEHAYWKATSVPALDPSQSPTVIVEVPKGNFLQSEKVDTAEFCHAQISARITLRQSTLRGFKMDMDEIETLNIELEHRVTKLEQGLVIAALKNELRKLKGKALDNEDTVTHSVVPKVSKDDMEPITPKLLNKRTAHSSYISYSQMKLWKLTLRKLIVLNKRNDTVNVNGSAVVQNLKKQDNSDCVGIHRDDCMSSDNLCVSNSLNVVKSRAKPKKNKSKKDIWKPTGKVVKSSSGIWIPVARSTMTRRIALSHQSFYSVKFLVTVKCRNDQVAKIMGFGDYQIGNVTISRVYYVEGLRHNLFSVDNYVIPI